MTILFLNTFWSYVKLFWVYSFGIFSVSFTVMKSFDYILSKLFCVLFYIDVYPILFLELEVRWFVPFPLKVLMSKDLSALIVHITKSPNHLVWISITPYWKEKRGFPGDNFSNHGAVYLSRKDISLIGEHFPQKKVIS